MADPQGVHVVLCRAREGAGVSPDFDERLAELLHERVQTPLTVMPHLYDLAADGPSFDRLRSISGPLVVLAWLPSRPAFWLLRAAGVGGTRAEGADESDDGTRRIWCFDLHDYSRPEDCVEAVRRIVSPAASAVRKAEVERIDESASARWYPVVDYDRCVTCLECLNFCLFGVYGIDDAEAVEVEQPDACRPGCPACARVCPSGAIMFPEHADPAISGRGSTADATPVAGAALPILDPLGQAIAERKSADARESSESTENHAGDSGDSRLDDLVDELDDLEL